VNAQTNYPQAQVTRAIRQLLFNELGLSKAFLHEQIASAVRTKLKVQLKHPHNQDVLRQLVVTAVTVQLKNHEMFKPSDVLTRHIKDAAAAAAIAALTSAVTITPNEPEKPR